MQIISMPRRGGKTDRMIEWLKRSETHVLVCMNEKERLRVLTHYFIGSERDEYKDRIITLSRQLSGRARVTGPRVIGFDNLDIILREIVSPNQLGPSTITEDL